MRVSELSAATGVPVSTIKYYVRSGLLTGKAVTATFTDYDVGLVREIRVIRALLGPCRVTVAQAAVMLRSRADGMRSAVELVARLHPGAEQYTDPAEPRRLLADLGWQPEPPVPAPLLTLLANSLGALEDAGVTLSRRQWRRLASAARRQAAIEQAVLSDESNMPVQLTVLRLLNETLVLIAHGGVDVVPPS